MTYTHYVCLKVLFRVQIEKETKGWQLLDEQHILFRAKSIAEAEGQLKLYASFIAEPWKNANKKWVRLTLEAVIDAYESDLPGEADFGEAGGMEVFSTYRRRRRKPEDYWDGA